ncbi:hypothetical protein ABK883_23400 [Enterobacter roggenkampii]|uniref:hypothetical protein n=1 Tax=Enterobacter roggenkampii TaxID=1812935 RepID=UPI00374F2812
MFVGKTLLHGDVLMWLMKTLLTSGCTNQRGAGHGVSDHGIRFWLRALRNIGVIDIDDESHYLSFTLKHIERDNVEFIYSNF